MLLSEHLQFHIDNRICIAESIFRPGSNSHISLLKEARELYDNGNKYIGSLLTVIFQEYTNDGIPRFPVGKGIRDIY